MGWLRAHFACCVSSVSTVQRERDELQSPSSPERDISSLLRYHSIAMPCCMTVEQFDFCVVYTHTHNSPSYSPLPSSDTPTYCSSHVQFQSNLLAEKYQELPLELGPWRDLLSNQSVATRSADCHVTCTISTGMRHTTKNAMQCT